MQVQIEKWFLFVIGALQVYLMNIISVVVLFALILSIDFVTGCLAAWRRGEQIESKKLRWSFVKLLCYGGSFAMTIFAGICVDNLEVFIQFVKIEIYVALWVEAVSITENLLVVFPRVMFLEFIHFMLSSVWVKKISGLIDFIKEKKADK